MSSKAWERFRIRRLAANPLALPKLTVISQATKDKLPAFLKPVIEEMERSNEQWRQNSQTTIEQAFMALKLDPGNQTTVVQQVAQAPAEEPAAPLRGPAGPAGPTGPTVTPYVHIQSTAAAVWVVSHHKGYYPSITLLTSTGLRFYSQEEHPSLDQTIIRNRQAITGKAICL